MRSRQAIIVALVAAGAFACDLFFDPPSTGGLQILVHRTGATAPAPVDGARARIIGPAGNDLQTRVVTLTLRGNAAFIDTVVGLAPGSYTVALEGLTGGNVAEFGQAAGVQVTAGVNAVATVTVGSFQPTMTVNQIPDSLAVLVSITVVAGATQYVVSWGADSTFGTGSQTATITTTTRRIDVPRVGRFFARARAVNEYASTGVWSDSLAVNVDLTAATVGVSPGVQTLTALGDSLQLSATARHANGLLIPGKRITWSSAPPGVVIVDSTGLVVAAAPGAVTITATANLASGTANIAVDQAVEAITVTAPLDTLSAGMSYAFTAGAADRRGNAIVGQAFAWQSSAQGTATVDTAGVVTGVGGGDVTISAFAEGKRGDRSVYFLPLAATVAVTPETDTITALGDTVRFTAAVLDANDNPIPGKPIVWSLSDSSLATLTSSGLLTATANGTVTVMATADTADGVATVAISQVATSVVVTAPADTLFTGTSIQFAAVARDSRSNALVGATFSWGTTDSLIATVNDAGLVTGVDGGTVSIVAGIDGVTGMKNVFFWPLAVEVDISPGSADVDALGDTVRFAAAALDSQGDTIPGKRISWSSSDPLVAAVDTAGLVTSVSNGSATIIASADAARDSVPLDVTQVPRSMVITSPGDTLFVNGSYQFLAIALDRRGSQVVGASVTWQLTDSSVASVDPSGLVSVLTTGQVTVIAASGVAADSVTIELTTAIIPSAGVLAFYSFSGHTMDASGGGHDGTLQGGAAFVADRAGNPMAALQFDGVNDVVGIGTTLKPPVPVTLAAWVRMDDSTRGTQWIFRNESQWGFTGGTTVTYGLWVWIDRGELNARLGGHCGGFGFANPRQRFSDEPVMRQGVWQHVAVVWEASDIRLYVDGTDRSGAYDGGCSGITYSGGSGALGEGLLGVFDDVRMFGRALTPGEIAALVAEDYMPPAVDSLALVTDSLTIDEGFTLPYSIEMYDANGTRIYDYVPANLTWVSTDSGIVALDPNWALAGIAPGTADISVTKDNGADTLTLTVRPPTTPFATLSAGTSHACGVTVGGSSYCWGANAQGQLGDGSTTQARQPSPLFASGLAPIAAGGEHSCGLNGSDAASCWGRNSDGQLGDSTLTSSIIPTPVARGLTFASIEAGPEHTCAIRASGEAWCWGDNRCFWTPTSDCTNFYADPDGYGRLGDSTYSSRSYPSRVAGGHAFVTVSPGPGHTCGVTGGGGAYCWGRNVNGKLGTGNTTTHANYPLLVVGGFSYDDISAGAQHTCAVETNGTGRCWGLNTSGQLGEGSNTNRLIPFTVSGGHSFTQIVAGSIHSCGLTTTGQVYCWGSGANGRLGNGLTATSNVPVKVFGQRTYTSIALQGSGATTCAVATTGAVYCWGVGANGQLGNNTTADSAIPVRVWEP